MPFLTFLMEFWPGQRLVKNYPNLKAFPAIFETEPIQKTILYTLGFESDSNHSGNFAKIQICLLMVFWPGQRLGKYYPNLTAFPAIFETEPIQKTILYTLGFESDSNRSGNFVKIQICLLMEFWPGQRRGKNYPNLTAFPSIFETEPIQKTILYTLGFESDSNHSGNFAKIQICLLMVFWPGQRLGKYYPNLTAFPAIFETEPIQKTILYTLGFESDSNRSGNFVKIQICLLMEFWPGQRRGKNYPNLTAFPSIFETEPIQKTILYTLGFESDSNHSGNFAKIQICLLMVFWPGQRLGKYYPNLKAFPAIFETEPIQKTILYTLGFESDSNRSGNFAKIQICLLMVFWPGQRLVKKYPNLKAFPAISETEPIQKTILYTLGFESDSNRSGNFAKIRICLF